MLCLMHEGTPYGYLRVGGTVITAEKLARMVGEPPARVRACLTELEAAAVFSRDIDGAIYSRRMVRDEAIRDARARGGEKSLKNPNVPRPKDRAEVAGKEGGKGYPSDPSFGGPPAVAVASACATARTTTANDRPPNPHAATKAETGCAEMATTAIMRRSVPTTAPTAEAVTQRLAAVLADVASNAQRKVGREQLLKLQAELVFAYFANRNNLTRTLFDAKRELRLIARLKENDGDVSELLYACDGAHLDPHLKGENDRAQCYADRLETVYRDRGMVERLARLTSGYRAAKLHPTAAKYANAIGLSRADANGGQPVTS